MSLSVLNDADVKPTYTTDELVLIKNGVKVSFLKQILSFPSGQAPQHAALKNAMDAGNFAVNKAAKEKLFGNTEAVPPLPNLFNTEVSNPVQNMFSSKFNGSTQQIEEVLTLLKKWFEEAEAVVSGWANAENQFGNLSRVAKEIKAKSIIPNVGVLSSRKVSRELVELLVFKEFLSNDLVGTLIPSEVASHLANKLSADTLNSIGTPEVFLTTLSSWIEKCKDGTNIINVVLQELSASFKNHLNELNASDELKKYLQEKGLITAAKCHKAMNSISAVNSKINELLFVVGDNKNMERASGFKVILSSAVYQQPILSTETKQDAPAPVHVTPVPETKSDPIDQEKTAVEKFCEINGKVKYSPPSSYELNAIHKEIKNILPAATPALVHAILNSELMDILEAFPFLSLEIKNSITSLENFAKLSKNYSSLKNMGSTKFITETESNTKAWFKKHNLKVEVDTSMKTCIAEMSNNATKLEAVTDDLFLNLMSTIHSVASDAYDICIHAHLSEENGKRAIIEMAFAKLSNAIEKALVDKNGSGKLDVNNLENAVMNTAFKSELQNEASAKVHAKTIELQKQSLALQQQLQKQLNASSSYKKRDNSNKRQPSEEHEEAPPKLNKGQARTKNFGKIINATKKTLGISTMIPIKNMPASIKNLFPAMQCMACVCGGVHDIECMNNHKTYQKMMPADVKKIIKDPQAFKAIY
jgi:hypothetical protein